jgi:hypothetical protein
VAERSAACVAERSGAAQLPTSNDGPDTGGGGPVSKAQVVFAIALSVIAVVIVLVGGYVVSSIRWGDRWYGRGRDRQ